VARTLALEPGAPITIVRRLLKLGDEPVVFDEIYLSSELFPDLSLDVLRRRESLYSLFETRYGVRMIRADERLRADVGRPDQRGAAAGGRGQPAAARRTSDFHLWPAGRMAARFLFDTQLSLSQ
jgi:DNA-binding GntR family transcriptional regulator